MFPIFRLPIAISDSTAVSIVSQFPLLPYLIMQHICDSCYSISSVLALLKSSASFKAKRT